MKRQSNIQQVKEHDKCPPNQTKEEEIGNLPEKEFRIMIVKMVQNVEAATAWTPNPQAAPRKLGGARLAAPSCFYSP